jgi:hypothetical protein
MASRQTVADLANWAPPQRITRKGNRTIVEKLNPGLNRKVVDLDGNVVGQSATNGIANRDPHDPYGMKIHAEKMYGNPRNMKGTPGGILPYAKCPQGISGVRQFLDEWDLGGRQTCEIAANGKAIDNSNPCKCIEELMAKRKAAAKERNDADEERINKLAKLAERTAEANLAATSQLADAAKALAEAANGSRRKPGKGDSE